MRLGFTSTRRGLVSVQLDLLEHFLVTVSNLREFHHGDCVGGDKEAHDLLRRFTLDVDTTIHVHPPLDPKYRAFCEGDVCHAELPYLERDRLIVDSTDRMVACPFEMTDQICSGTWYTIRYAQKQNKPLLIIFPNGDVRNMQPVAK